MTTPIPSLEWMQWTVDASWIWVWLICETSGKTLSLLKLPRCNSRAGNHPHSMTQHLMRINDSDGKESACKAGGPGLIPGLGRAPGEGNGCPLRYSYLKNPTDRGAGRQQSTESQRVGHPCMTNTHKWIQGEELTRFLAPVAPNILGSLLFFTSSIFTLLFRRLEMPSGICAYWFKQKLPEITVCSWDRLFS